MQHSRHIGDVVLSGRTILAPTCGVLNRPMRAAFRCCGAAMSCVGAIDATAVAGSTDAGLINLLGRAETVCDQERPVSVQLIGPDAASMAEAAGRIEPLADVIDLNFSGPLRSVLDAGAGAALLAKPERIAEITAAVVDRVAAPVTVKLRLGVAGRDADVVGIARRCEDAGAAAVAIHARTAHEGYTGPPHWPAIAAVKRAVGMPVIGNGAVYTAADAKAMVERTGCDFVMICTAAFIDPMIFRKADALLGVSGAARAPRGAGVLGFMLEYCRLIRRLEGKGRRAAFKKAFRQFAAVRSYMKKLKSGRVGFGQIAPRPWPKDCPRGRLHEVEAT